MGGEWDRMGPICKFTSRLKSISNFPADTCGWIVLNTGEKSPVSCVPGCYKGVGVM